MNKKNGWFEVDKEGLAKLLERRDKSFVLFELVQNAWDTNAKNVKVELTNPVDGESDLRVEDDDPDGFQFLHHAWTLFAESVKKGDPEKRGRFNLGEKLVLAACTTARLITTKGGVSWDLEGRHESLGHTDHGSVFTASIKLAKADYDYAIQQIKSALPPRGVKTTVNGEPIHWRKPVRTFRIQLPTEIADEEGNLRSTRRVTDVEVHGVPPGEIASIYEMGIPVVETGDKWHVNIMQKVPLNSDRDNVTPGFLQKVRTAVLNEMFGEITVEDSTSQWVRAATADKDVLPAAVEKVMTERFGERRVVVDPSDPEGTKIAMSKGYQVVFPGALSKGEWQNVRNSGAILPAGQVTPSPKPYSPEGRPEKVKPESEWTDDMRRRVNFCKNLFSGLIGKLLNVSIVVEPMEPWLANFGGQQLCLNYGKLGKRWFALPNRDVEVLDLLLHEFVHHTAKDHLSHEMHEHATRLGAKLANLCLDKPEMFI